MKDLREHLNVALKLLTGLADPPLAVFDFNKFAPKEVKTVKEWYLPDINIFDLLTE